ncbi:hypothetical protein CLV57_0283 [Mucilaginibacter auburnensis]|uniref:Uncharacterized protein n=1 Tax=Mucilaginibacter auburnensis TaxID=1457233 RepID=A0A2H9VR79_9SPHI|nr:hypothetical protein CLV57_0283 [Mucilaginibacter auburnensis]
MYFIDHGQAAKFLFEKILVFSGIAQGNLEDKIVFAGEVQADLYLGVDLDRSGKGLQHGGGVAVEFDQGDHQGWTADEAAVEEGGKSADITLFAEFGQAFADRGFAFMNGQPDMGRVHPGILLEDLQDTDIGRIELAVLRHGSI